MNAQQKISSLKNPNKDQRSDLNFAFWTRPNLPKWHSDCFPRASEDISRLVYKFAQRVNRRCPDDPFLYYA